MERSREIFLKITTASKKVVTSANDHARCIDRCGVSRAHFQLEAEMRRISVACSCIVDVLRKSTLLDGPAFDIRLQDWLDSDGPQECLDTLVCMDRLLQTSAFSWVSWVPWVSGGRALAEDKIKEAVEYFSSCKACFHFLFSTEIWNNQNDVQHQDNVVRPESIALAQDSPAATRTETNIAVPHSTIHRDGIVKLVAREDPGVLGQSLLVHDEIIADAIDAAIPFGGRSQGSEEVMLDAQRAKVEDEELKGIVNWLDGLNCAEKHDDTSSLRQPDTCKWLFGTVQYKTWKDGANSFLWLRGKPGAGKSVLASFVIDSLKTTLRQGEVLSFFYCDFRNERSTSTAEALRSVLSQLLRELRGGAVNPARGSLIEDLLEEKERGGSTRKNAKELAAFVCRAASLFSEKPVVVIDALDECKDVRMLVQALKDIRNDVQLFVTSRPLHAIMEDLTGLPSISMDEMELELSADIRLHVTRELDARHRLRGLPADFKTEILLVLCAKACGMFRWIQCSLDTLDRCVNRTGVRLALTSLPVGLDETYERILRAIDKKEEEGLLAQRALTWLVAALRPLSLNELMGGLSINLRTRTLDSNFGPMHSGVLLDVCGSLVTYTEKTGIIVLSHLSVKEYLMGQLILRKLPRYHIDSGHAHLQLLQSCICYLFVYLSSCPASSKSSTIPSTDVRGFSSRNMDQLRIISQPLRDYALDDAVDHFRHLGSQFKYILRDIQVLDSAIQQHRSAWDNLHRSTCSTAPSWPLSKHDLMLYILVAYAPTSLLRARLRRTALEPTEGTNPLVYAAYFDKVEHTQTLLWRGAKLNQRGWDIGGFFQVTPIEVALQNRRYTLVTLFIEEGSYVPLQVFTDPSSCLSTPDNDIPSFVAKILFQTEDFAEAAKTVLSAVALPMGIFERFLHGKDTDQDNFKAILRRFIQVADDNNLSHDDFLAELLHFAFKWKDDTLATYLLSSGGPLPWDDLGKSCCNRKGSKKSQMIRFLVENGASIHGLAASGGPILPTLLLSTSDEKDALEIVKVLLSQGSDPPKAGSSRHASLQIAIERGFISVVRHLLEHSPDKTASIDLRIALALENEEDRASMITCLVENDADVHVWTLAGEPVLHTVLRSFTNEDSALEITKVLIGHHRHPLEFSFSGKTALQIAVERGFVSITRYLSSATTPSSELLHIGLELEDEQKRASMIVCLVEEGADVDACIMVGEPVLCAVLQSFRSEDCALETAEALLRRGCYPLKAGVSRKNSLQIAIERGFVSVVQRFCSNITPPSELLQVALGLEDEQKRASMINCLVSNQTDFHAWTLAGEPVLHTALRSFTNENIALEITKVLVGHCCHPLEVNSSGKTALQVAVECGFVSIVQYLVSDVTPPSCLLRDALELEDEQKRVSMIVCLVEKGVKVDTCTMPASGEPVLHAALRSFRNEDYALESIQALGHHCHPLGSGFPRKTPLQIAVECGFAFVAQYLLAHFFDNTPSADLLRSALELKDEQDRASMIICLLENKPDVRVHAYTTGIAGEPLLHVVLRSFENEDHALDTTIALVGHRCEADSLWKAPLRIAVERGFVSVVRHLLRHSRGSLDSTECSGLLRVALQLRDEQVRASVIVCLVANFKLNGTDVHTSTIAGELVVHLVLRSFRNEYYALEAVKALLGRGPSPQEASSSGKALLQVRMAIGLGFLSVAQYILSLNLASSFDPLQDGPNAVLRIAVACAHVTLTRSLLSVYTLAPSADLLQVALKIKSEHKRTRIIVCLLENGVHIHSHTHAVLQTISRGLRNENDALRIAKTLVGRDCCNRHEVGSCGEYLLRMAVERGYLALMHYLLSLKISPSPDLLQIAMKPKAEPRSIFHRSEDEHHIASIIVCLVENGADVHARTTNGEPVLNTALKPFQIRNEGATPRNTEGSSSSYGQTLLRIAVERGFLSLAQYLFSLGIPPSPGLLHTALISQLQQASELKRKRTNPRQSQTQTREQERRRASMIICLLENGADAHTPTATGDPILYAVLQSFEEEDNVMKIVKLLVHRPSFCRETLVCMAVKRGFVSLTQYLLSFGITPFPDLLHLAVEVKGDKNKASMITCLVEKGAVVSASAATLANEPVFLTALKSFRTEAYALQVARLLVSHHCDLQGGKILLRVAIKHHFLALATYLLSLNITPSSGDPVLCIALRNFWREDEALKLAKLLFEHGCGRNFSGPEASPLRLAVENGYVSLTRYLLSLDIPPPPDLLHVALESGVRFLRTLMRDMTVCLLENGVDVHARTATGDPVLYTALRVSPNEDDALDIIKLLVCHGCDPHEVGTCGNNLLYVAVERGFVSVAQYLHSLNMFPSPELLLIALKSDLQLPSLSRARRSSAVRDKWVVQEQNKAAMIVCLVENGADVQACLPSQAPLLQTALKAFSEDKCALTVTKALVCHGCDPHGAGPSGKTPFQIAIERGFVSVARYFLSLGVLLPPDPLPVALQSHPQGRRKQLAMLRFLLGCRADAHVVQCVAVGDPVVHAALQWSLEDSEDLALETLKLLVHHGCDPLERDSRGKMPIHFAVEQGCISLARFLLSLGAYPSPLSDLLWVALRSQLGPRCKSRMVGFLIHQGASVSLEMVDVLEAANCDAEAGNARGKALLRVGVDGLSPWESSGEDSEDHED